MALNSSGPISLAGSTAGQSIAVELGQSASGQISLNDTNVRTLAGVSSGAITMPTNFYGKSNAPTFAYVTSTLQNTSPAASTITYSSFSIGSANAGRRVIVLVNAQENAGTTGLSLSSVTVGGQSTTIAVSVVNNRTLSAICITDSPVTSGTTANIVLTFNKNVYQNGIATYTAVNLSSATATATATATSNNSSQTVNVSADGCLFGNGGSVGYYGEGGNITWTNLTRNYFIDGYPSGIGFRTSGASFVVSSTGGRSVTCSFTDEYEPAVCYASFR